MEFKLEEGDLPWIQPDIAMARQIKRLACLFTRNLSFEPLLENIVVTDNPEAASEYYTVARLAGKNEGDLLYGIVSPGRCDFYPIAADGIAVELYKFVIEKEPGFAEDGKMQHNFAAVISVVDQIREMEASDRVSFDRHGTYFPTKNWEYVDDQNPHFQDLYRRIAAFFTTRNISISQIWRSKLTFSATYLLYEVVGFAEESYYVRSYFFLKWDEESVADDNIRIVSIDGTSKVIHEIWETDSDFFLTSENVADYLRFFCWAIQGDDGQFIVSGNLYEMPWATVPEETRRPGAEIIAKLKSPVLVPAIAGNDDPHDYLLDTSMAYGNALFLAKLGVVRATGLVEMIDDEPLVADQPFDVQRFDSKFHRVYNDSLSRIMVVDDLADQLDHARGACRQDADGELFSLLYNTGTARDLTVQYAVNISDFTPNKGNHTSLPGEVVIENCHFLEPVRLLESCITAFPVRFRSCIFEAGFFANETTQKNSLSFENCLFRMKDEGDTTPVVINLHFLRLEGDLLFSNCRILGQLLASNMQVASNFELCGCHLHNQLLKGRVLMQELQKAFLNNNGRVEIHGQEFHLKRDVSAPDKTAALVLRNARINGNLRIGFLRDGSGDHFNYFSSIVSSDIFGQGLTVSGGVDFSGTLLTGELNLTNAVIGQDLQFSYFDWSIVQFYILGRSLSLINATISGSISLNHAEVQGTLDLYRVKVGNYVQLDFLRCNGDLDMNFADIRGIVVASLSAYNFRGREPLEIRGSWKMSGASISSLRIEGGRVHKVIDCYASTFTSIKLTMGIAPDPENPDRLKPMPMRAAGLLFSSVTVEGNMNLSGLEVKVEGSRSLDNSVYQSVFNETGDIGCRIESSTIHGNLMFFSARMYSDLLTKVQDLDLLTRNIASGYFDSSPSAEPMQNLPPAFVRGSLSLKSNQIHGELDLRKMRVEKDIILSDCFVKLGIQMNTSFRKRKSRAYGDEVVQTSCRNFYLQNLQCDGDLHLSGLNTTDVDGSGARILGSVFLIDEEAVAHSKLLKAQIGGVLNFTSLEAGYLNLANENFPISNRRGDQPVIILEKAVLSELEIESPPPPINLNNVTIKKWSFIPHDAALDANALTRKYCEILRQTVPFEKSTYSAVEMSLRNEGRKEEADAIYISMRKRASRNLRGVARLLDRTGGFIHGYKTKTLRLLVFWMIILVITTVLFTMQENVLQNGEPLDAPLSLPNAFLLACKYCIPLFSLGFMDNYTFASSEVGLWVVTAAILSYTFLGVGLAAITSKMRKEG